jgi:hypothetical protein
MNVSKVTDQAGSFKQTEWTSVTMVRTRTTQHSKVTMVATAAPKKKTVTAKKPKTKGAAHRRVDKNRNVQSYYIDRKHFSNHIVQFFKIVQGRAHSRGGEARDGSCQTRKACTCPPQEDHKQEGRSHQARPQEGICYFIHLRAPQDETRRIQGRPQAHQIHCGSDRAEGRP